MKAKVVTTILLTLTLAMLGAMVAPAQQAQPANANANAKTPGTTPGKSAQAHDQQMMNSEPHHILAMAYHQNLSAFAWAMQEQMAGASSVDRAFADDVLAEMRRSFDQMKGHYQEHVATMTPDMKTRATKMMEQMTSHQAELEAQMASLEKEIKSDTSDARRVSALAAAIHTHCNDMTKMHQANNGVKTGSK